MHRFAWMAIALLALSGTASAAEFAGSFGLLPLAPSSIHLNAVTP